MADRDFQFPQTQGVRTILLPVTLIGQGAGKAPILGVGDPKGAFWAQPVYVNTGVFTITTIDAYPNAAANGGVIACTPSYALASPAAGDQILEGPAAAFNAGPTPPLNTITFTFNCFTAASLADVLLNDLVRLNVVLQNSSVSL